MSDRDMELLAAIDDLIKQATTERSHYYTASVLLACRDRLAELFPAAQKRK